MEYINDSDQKIRKFSSVIELIEERHTKNSAISECLRRCVFAYSYIMWEHKAAFELYLKDNIMRWNGPECDLLDDLSKTYIHLQRERDSLELCKYVLAFATLYCKEGFEQFHKKILTSLARED